MTPQPKSNVEEAPPPHVHILKLHKQDSGALGVGLKNEMG